MKSKDARSKGGKHMQEYKAGGDSGVTHYEILEDGIILKFKRKPYLYLYTYLTPGIEHVEQMIENAKKNEKLSTYVSQNVQDNYADKWIPRS